MNGMTPDPMRILGGVFAQDGTFEIRNLLPGAYELDALRGRLLQVEVGRVTVSCCRIGSEIENAGGMARTNVSVAGSNVDGVVLSLAAPLEVSGTIKIEGGGSLAKVPTMGLLDASGITLNGPTVQIKDDGAFAMKGLAPSQYLLNVTSLPEGF